MAISTCVHRLRLIPLLLLALALGGCGSGSDEFVFSGSNGTDHIEDFENGVDTIVIEGYGAALNQFSQLVIFESGGDTFVVLSAGGGGEIVLENTDIADIDNTDFAFV